MYFNKLYLRPSEFLVRALPLKHGGSQNLMWRSKNNFANCSKKMDQSKC